MNGLGRLAVCIILLVLLAGSLQSFRAPDEPEGCDLPAGEQLPGPLDNQIVFQVEVTRFEVEVRVCIVDERGIKIHDFREMTGQATVWEHRVDVPDGAYIGDTQITTEGGRFRATHAGNPSQCSARTILFPTRAFNNGPAGSGVSPTAASCVPFHSGSGVEPNQADGPVAAEAPESFFGTESAQDVIRWELLGGAFVVVGLALWPRSRYLLLGLFTRLQGPAVLEQETRGEIYALVKQDPGVNAHRIAHMLGLGSGETRYHLTVLRRNRLITEVRRGSLRCFFLSAVASPDQLRATAALRNHAAERLYDAVLAAPDGSLSTLAADAGLRISQASKALRRLVDAGLVRRAQEGREVRVRPTGIRPLTAAFESNASSEALPVS